MGLLAAGAASDEDAGIMESTWQSILEHLRDAWPPSRWAGTGVVVGCSGGGDSVALTRLLNDLQRRHSQAGFLVIAHLNHRLRGDASDHDQAFVADLAERLELSIDVGVAERHGPTDEESLRRRRLRFFSDVAARRGARYVALGHTSDDQVETVLHHLMRGTGPNGLTGMASHRPLDQDFVLVRPMLGLSRKQIRDALTEIDQAWCEDASNRSNAYTRNWIRNEVLPLMRQRFPGVDGAITRAAGSIATWQDHLHRSARKWIDTAVRIDRPVSNSPAESVDIDSQNLPDDGVIIAGVSMVWDDAGWSRGGMTSDHWNRIVTMLRSPPTAGPQANLPGDIRFHVREHRIRFLHPGGPDRRSSDRRPTG